jgi:hypothetical protein
VDTGETKLSRDERIAFCTATDIEAKTQNRAAIARFRECRCKQLETRGMENEVVVVVVVVVVVDGVGAPLR